MTIQKNKHTYLAFDNGTNFTLYENIEGSKHIVIVDYKATKPNMESGIVILNPGEYEYNGVLIKIASDNNILVSAEGLKFFYMINMDIAKDNKYADAADVYVFDNDDEKAYKMNDVLDFIKNVEAKVVVVNEKMIDESPANAEKMNKVKLKSSEVDLLPETKFYLI